MNAPFHSHSSTHSASFEKKIKRQILVTAALPYANGSIHLGHMVEHIQTDVWARNLKMQGHEVYFICAEDAHGTAIMLRAQKENISPEELINKSWHEHYADFQGFNIDYDHYYSTHTTENESLAKDIYIKLKEANLIESRLIEQAYDPVAELFLPDRFIKGSCPKCHAVDQYGDACEVCNAIYSPTDLLNAYSVVSGSAPIKRNSTHYFFKLSNQKCFDYLIQWIQNLAQNEVVNKLREWLALDEQQKPQLADWDISRDAPYFGFEIPDAPGKYFYVWLDAPVGYYASFQNFCKKNNLVFEDWVKADTTTEQYHFVGKDIFYFHTLFWPAMLQFSGYRSPTNVFVHGFLTVNSQKMSKSRGTFITARTYLESGLDPDYLRYYFCAKLNSKIEDIDLNLQDLMNRVNSDLVGKFINIASRTANFIVNKFQAKINDDVMQCDLLSNIRMTLPIISSLYEKREYSQAVKQIISITDQINLLIDNEKPWELARADDENKQLQLHQLSSICLEAFRLITIAIKPITPSLAKRIENFLNISPLTWADINKPLSSSKPIHSYQHLIKRIDVSLINKLIFNNS